MVELDTITTEPSTRSERTHRGPQQSVRTRRRQTSRTMEADPDRDMDARKLGVAVP